eukprot:Hpha_TRINITY_DN12720_c0_g2::TRINITY_DN12720_c0_g2_i1::g.114634::m.114634
MAAQLASRIYTCDDADGTIAAPSLNAPDSELRGPTAASQWLLPGKLIVGAYPGLPSRAEHPKVAQNVVQAAPKGCTFLCLQPVQELKDRGLSPYPEHALEEAERRGLPPPEFLHCPTRDLSIGRDADLRSCLETAADRVRAGRVVYAHCFGGKGRTGTFATAFLSRFCNVDTEPALDFFVRGHETRRHQGIGVTRRLHGQDQIDQARRVGREKPGEGEGSGKGVSTLPLRW